MRYSFSNLILSILLICVLALYYLMNINEVEKYNTSAFHKYFDLLIKIVNYEIESKLNDKLDRNSNEVNKIDSIQIKLLKATIENLMTIEGIYYIIIQTNDNIIISSTKKQENFHNLPKIKNDEFLKIYQSLTPDITEVSINNLEGLEIRSIFDLKFEDPAIIRLGLDANKFTEPYNNYLLNSFFITLFLVLILLFFINYQDVLKQNDDSLTSDKQLIFTLTKVFEQSLDGIIFIDAHKTIKIFNSSAEHITEIKKQISLLNDYSQIFPNDYFNVDEVLTTQKSFGPAKIEFISNNQQKRILYFTTNYLLIDKQFKGILISIQDITQIEKDNNLQFVKKQLEVNSKLARTLTSEFIDRINRLYLIIQSLQNESQISAELFYKKNQIALSEVLENEAFVKKLQEFVDIPKVEYLQVSLKEIVQEVFHNFNQELAKKSIAIQVDIRDFLTFFVDDKLLIQIISILLENSIEAIEDDGTIVVSAGQTMQYTTIKITDTGCGIPVHIQNNLYNPFNTNKAERLGLGLAKAYKYMTLLSGEVTYTTSENLGTTFIITLPNRFDLKWAGK